MKRIAIVSAVLLSVATAWAQEPPRPELQRQQDAVLQSFPQPEATEPEPAVADPTPAVAAEGRAPGDVSTQTVADDASGNMIFSTNGLERMRITTSGDVGIGTNAPAAKLHVLGALGVSAGLWHQSHIPSPGGNQYRTTSPTVTGYLKITLPGKWTNTMLRMQVDIYEYSPGVPRTIILGGYSYIGGTTFQPGWYGTSATQLANDATPMRVEFGDDGVNHVIYISKGTSGASSSWSYPQVVVHNVYAGFSNNIGSNWDAGWAVSFVTTGFTVKSTVTAGTALVDDGTGRFGMGSTAPAAKLHIADTAKVPRVILSGTEYYTPSGQTAATSAEGIGLYVGVNRDANRQLWIGDTAGTASTPFVRVISKDNVAGIDAISRDGNTVSNLGLASYGGQVIIGTKLATDPVRNDKLQVNGDAHVNGTLSGKVVQATYQDVAEWVPATTDLAPGTVVVLNTTRNNEVMHSSNAYDTTVAGVVSAQPGLSLGIPGEGKEQIATTGRVKVRVDARQSPIRVGDLLVTSDMPGTAMRSQPMDLNGRKFHQPGTIIGKALEPLESGVGEILVLLSMQ